MNENIINLKNQINAEKHDDSKSNPRQIIANILSQVEQITNGIVLAKINRYKKSIKEMSSIVNIGTLSIGDIQKN